jgi:hypothetical protein
MKKSYLKKYIKEEIYRILELFDKDLPNINKISNTTYIVGNNNDIEAKYYFKLEIPEKDAWSLNWEFTQNNKNTSPESWKQITSTSIKILQDFIQNNHPKSIHISGNTDAKTNIYKSYPEKLENIFNNEYKVDNSDEHKIVLRSIQEVKQFSIKKRMETMNESYKQSLNYFKNGDIYSKSKIERVNTIKKIAKRIISEFLYK